MLPWTSYFMHSKEGYGHIYAISYLSNYLQPHKMYWLCTNIFYLFTASRKCTHTFMVQVVDFPYLKLLKYFINVSLLKESFELLKKKLDEDYYMNAHKCPCVGMVLKKTKKTPTCFCSEIISLSFIANIYPLWNHQSHLMKSRDLSQLLLDQYPKLPQ